MAPLMARTVHDDPRLVRSGLAEGSLTCGYAVERVTRIEPALSAWESVPSRALTCPELRSRLSASDREIPVFTGVNGTLMARRSWPEPSRWSYRPSAFQAGHIPSWHKSSERYALWPVAAGCHRSLLLLSPLLSPAMRPRLAAFLPGCGRDAPCPNGYNGLSFPNCYEVCTDDDGHLIRAASV
jgi:hypothetical protein